jgi:hypothetical protein
MDDYKTDYKANGTPITGQSLAHLCVGKQARAILAAELVVGAKMLTSPTAVQASHLLGVSTTYVHAALDIVQDPNLVGLVIGKKLALVDAAARQQQKALPKPTVMAAIPTDAEIDHVIAAAGIARTWDRLSAAIS